VSDVSLSQDEANALLVMKKFPADDGKWIYPPLGGSISIPLISSDKKESFFLDVARGQINLYRGKYQNRSRQIIVLARLDFGGPPHRNPDGQEIPCPHLHVYQEGYADKWAYPVSMDDFPNIANPNEAVYDFMNYCNIVDFPDIQFGLFYD